LLVELVREAPSRRSRCFTCLAPDIVEAILYGWQPKGLRLAEVLGNGPTGWEEQRRNLSR
jgi:hypothetical protein